MDLMCVSSGKFDITMTITDTDRYSLRQRGRNTVIQKDRHPHRHISTQTDWLTDPVRQISRYIGVWMV